VTKGSSGVVATASASGQVGVGVNGFANNPTTGDFSKAVFVSELLDANGT
jgi:hypothetical protein